MWGPREFQANLHESIIRIISNPSYCFTNFVLINQVEPCIYCIYNEHNHQLIYNNLIFESDHYYVPLPINSGLAVLCNFQDRKPLVPEVGIPQSLRDQADAQIKALGGATTEENEAEMVKARIPG